jgi:hypothetical protein
MSIPPTIPASSSSSTPKQPLYSMPLCFEWIQVSIVNNLQNALPQCPSVLFFGVESLQNDSFLNCSWI